MKKLTNEKFIEKAKEVHGDKYDYSECVYEHSLKKVIIKCPIHGPFKIKPSNHTNNKQGCWSCGNESTGKKQKKSLEVLLSQIAKKPNSDNYDFSLIKDFKNSRDLVSVICNKHGKYDRPIRDILRSNYFGCKKCKISDDAFTKEIFVQKSIMSHGDKYSYKKVKYTRSHDPVTIICKEHGEFTVAPYIHVAGGGFCPSCTDFVSSYEIELKDYLKSQSDNLRIETSCRSIKGIKEIDLLVDKKIAIEFDGLYWHSDLFKKKNYHAQKTKKASELGLRLIHIFEDEWLNKKDICKSIIINTIGCTKNKIYARKCKIKEVSPNEARKFLEENHIQGFCPSTYRCGLYEDDVLVSLMTFGPNRICLGGKPKKNEYELLRFCNLKFNNVVGGASKLFKYFVQNLKPSKITSYCDIRWGSGNVYEVLGFKKIKETPPNYFYVRGNKRFGRFGFRKNLLVAKGHDPRKTEKQIMSELGYNRIYDCGNMKFEWTKQGK